MAETAFIGYSGDCVVRGMVDVPEGVRLTDFLNDAETVGVRGAQLFALEDGHVVDAGDIELTLDELLAVEAPPSQSDPKHRVSTRARRVQFQIAPYEILGHVHSPPAADPMASIARRKPMVPLTEATIALTFAGRSHLRDIDVLIVNRDRARTVEAVEYEPSKLDEFVLRKVDPRARDMTGALYGPPGEATL